MGTLIKEMLDAATLQTLTSNFDPGMIRQEKVAQAASALVKAIKSLELCPSLQSLIDQFDMLREHHPIYAHRPFYMWQWMQAGYQLTSLNLPDADFLRSNSVKCRIGFLTVLLDDICDLGRDRTDFDQCVLALKGHINQYDMGLYQLIADTSSAFHGALTQAPNYALLKPALEEAYQKWIDTFEYSLLIQEEAFRLEQTWERHLENISHSGTVYLGGVIDLLFAPNLLAHQASAVAAVSLRTQKLIQIANWITSWKRELAQGDLTSGVFSMALENHWIDWDDLKNGSIGKTRQQIQNSPAEDYLWNEWKRLRVEGYQIAMEAQLPMLDGYVESFSALMFIQLASTELR